MIGFRATEEIVALLETLFQHFNIDSSLKIGKKMNQLIPLVFNAIQENKGDVLGAQDITCFRRFEHEGSYFCVPNMGQAKPLLTLKICAHCTKRLHEQSREILALKTRYYNTCGAREYVDKAKGLMLFCHKNPNLNGSWVTPNQCLEVKCSYMKVTQTS